MGIGLPHARFFIIPVCFADVFYGCCPSINYLFFNFYDLCQRKNICMYGLTLIYKYGSQCLMLHGPHISPADSSKYTYKPLNFTMTCIKLSIQTIESLVCYEDLTDHATAQLLQGPLKQADGRGSLHETASAHISFGLELILPRECYSKCIWKHQFQLPSGPEYLHTTSYYSTSDETAGP